MLPPGYLESLPDAVVELIQEMEDAILSKMAIRITKYGWTDQSQWEKDRLEAVGVVRSDIVRILSQYTGQTEQAIQDAMADAGRTTVAQDRRYYEAAGMWREEAINREAMNKVINAGLRRTQGTFLNLTGTLAKETAKEFTKAMDRAWLEVSTGTIDAPTAGRRAIKELCAKGIQVVSYPSGHTDHVEVAVRRALVTGVNQGAMAVQDELMGELDCDLVETTAHAGARPEHALWQGKVFSRFGRTPGYATLAAGTGFGTGAGLGGWNCRHSYHPFFPGYESAYSDDILKEYQRKTCTYNGKALTDYEASQQQRYFERGIRRWKREYTAMDAAGLDTTQASVKLKQWREKEADFLKQTGRRRDSSRSQIGTFGRSEAGKATWQAQEYYNVWSKSIGVKESIKTLAKYYDVKYNDSPRYELLQQYVKDVKSGWVSPLSGFTNYETLHNRVESELVGKQTANGIQITGQSKHFIQRIIGTEADPIKTNAAGQPVRRSGVEFEEIADAILNGTARPLKVDAKTGSRSQKFCNGICEVSINPDTGTLIQCNPKKERST